MFYVIIYHSLEFRTITKVCKSYKMPTKLNIIGANKKCLWIKIKLTAGWGKTEPKIIENSKTQKYRLI